MNKKLKCILIIAALMTSGTFVCRSLDSALEKVYGPGGTYDQQTELYLRVLADK